MKITFVLLASLFAWGALAEGPELNKEMFEKIKTESLTELDQRISNLQTAKSCTASAKDMPALKNCRETLEQSMRALQEQRKGKRQGMRNQMLDERIKRLQEEKNKTQPDGK